MTNDEKLIVNVEFVGAAKQDFLDLKQKIRLENNTDVIRWAIADTNKRMM